MVVRRTLIRKPAGKTLAGAKTMTARRASSKVAAVSPETRAEVKRLRRALPHTVRMEFATLARKFDMTPGMDKALAQNVFILNSQIRFDSSPKMNPKQRAELIKAMMKMKQAIGA